MSFCDQSSFLPSYYQALLMKKYAWSLEELGMYKSGELLVPEKSNQFSMLLEYASSNLNLKDFMLSQVFTMELSKEDLYFIVEEFLDEVDSSALLKATGPRIILGYNIDIVFVLQGEKPLCYTIQGM